MGKKSLLAPTSVEKTGNEEGSEKATQALKTSGAAKKTSPKAPKKKASKAAAPKKKAAPKRAKKKAPKVVGAKKKSPVSNKAKKKAAPKRTARKKGAPAGSPVKVTSSYKTGSVATSPAPKTAARQEASDLSTIPRCEDPAPTVNGRQGGDPTQRMAVFGLLVLAALLLMVLWASASNVGKFYLKPADGQLEIWKGRFSPKGRDKVFTLANTSFPLDSEAIFSQEEVYTLIFEDIIADADMLLRTDEIPDFDNIRRTLVSASPFAVSAEMTGRLQRRQDKIDMMALAYKADILSGKGAVGDLTLALESLEKALGLNLDEAEKGLLLQKINWIKQRLSEIDDE